MPIDDDDGAAPAFDRVLAFDEMEHGRDAGSLHAEDPRQKVMGHRDRSSVQAFGAQKQPARHARRQKVARVERRRQGDLPHQAVEGIVDGIVEIGAAFDGVAEAVRRDAVGDRAAHLDRRQSVRKAPLAKSGVGSGPIDVSGAI